MKGEKNNGNWNYLLSSWRNNRIVVFHSSENVKGEKMSNVMIIVGFVVVVIAALVGSWYLADWIVPQSDIDKIEAIGRWAKEELERREAGKERREDGNN